METDEIQVTVKLWTINICITCVCVGRTAVVRAADSVTRDRASVRLTTVLNSVSDCKNIH